MQPAPNSSRHVLSAASPSPVCFCRCACAHAAQAIEATFYRRSTLLGECLSLAAQQVSTTIRNFVEIIKVRFRRSVRPQVLMRVRVQQRMGTKRLSERMLDVLASLCLLADAMVGPPTDARRAVALTALDIANQRVRPRLRVVPSPAVRGVDVGGSEWDGVSAMCAHDDSEATRSTHTSSPHSPSLILFFGWVLTSGQTILKDTEFNELRVAIHRLQLIGVMHRLLRSVCCVL
jgi:hypothetical protein